MVQLRILCLSHLAWDWVWQRPQQILTRLAAHCPVIYVNEPRRTSLRNVAALECVVRQTNLTALQPVSSEIAGPGQWSPAHFGLIRDYLLEQRWFERDGTRLKTTRPLVGWFYSPMPVSIIDHVPLDLIVYDAMDELANFKGAPAEIRDHEERLLAEADLVFAGSPSLCEEKRRYYPRAHLFSSGVDINHFGARGAHLTPELDHAARPIIGYYGVIDERIDLHLLDSVAALRPQWTWVVLGPVTKIDPQDLPQRSNIHYLGMKHYDALPGYLSAFDVAMMPFAINKATMYIKPTKLLEFMAAQKPIVSTPLHDVSAIGSPAVNVAATPEDFVGRIESLLNETADEKAARLKAQAQLVRESSWDWIVEDMRGLINDALVLQDLHDYQD